MWVLYCTSIYVFILPLCLTELYSFLQKVLKERGIDTMVDDARKSGSSETDAEFLKKSWTWTSIIHLEVHYLKEVGPDQEGSGAIWSFQRRHASSMQSNFVDRSLTV